MDILPIRHIIVAVDESEASIKTLDWTIDNLYKEGDTIHLFHVIPPGQCVVLSTDLGVEEVVEDDAETQKRVEDHARAYIDEKLAPLLEKAKVPYHVEICKFATDNESIGSIICKRADQLNAAAVAMARHTKGTIKEFFVGSCTTHVTKHCKSPVLVMHCD